MIPVLYGLFWGVVISVLAHRNDWSFWGATWRLFAVIAASWLLLSLVVL